MCKIRRQAAQANKRSFRSLERPDTNCTIAKVEFVSSHCSSVMARSPAG
jgi:hypothetical protein